MKSRKNTELKGSGVKSRRTTTNKLTTKKGHLSVERIRLKTTDRLQCQLW